MSLHEGWGSFAVFSATGLLPDPNKKLWDYQEQVVHPEECDSGAPMQVLLTSHRTGRARCFFVRVFLLLNLAQLKEAVRGFAPEASTTDN